MKDLNKIGLERLAQRTILYGSDAIAFARSLGPEQSCLNKFCDSVDAAAHGISVAFAEEVSREDASLIWCWTDGRAAEEETMAEVVAERLGYDGMAMAVDGITIDELCKELHPTETSGGVHTRFTFRDKSSIIVSVSGDGWDLGVGPDCMCMHQGFGDHDERCEDQ